MGFFEECVILLLLGSFYLVAAQYPSLKRPLCHANERSALLQFKESFIFDCYANSILYISSDPYAYPKMATWNHSAESGDCCSWDGVKCNETTGHVIGLHLSSSCLYGSINASSSLFHLVQLQKLNLAFNNFNYSNIPSEFRYFSRLAYLNLSYSMFSGQIPSAVLELSELEFLVLSGNMLELKNPTFSSLLEKLSNLRKLFLGDVDISSAIPHSLTNLLSLASLSLRNCGLYGDFPSKIFQLPNLQYLSVADNPFLRGYLPEFQQGSPMEVLRVWNTSFSGSIPDSLANLAQLTYLGLSDNNFSHWTMSCLGKLTNLTYLDLQNTNLYGDIPSSLQNLTQLTYLDLRYNQLTGLFPSWLGNLTQLEVLALNSNNLYGPIPQSVSRLINLELFDIGNNYFNGTLQLDVFSNLTFLWFLSLDNNNLSLLINPNLNNTVQKFNVLNLESTNLIEFPVFLQKQDELLLLSLASNKIDGKIPQWMMNVSAETLIVLNLQDNFLTGFEQPPSILPWRRLEHLILGNNRLQGSIPIPSASLSVYSIPDNRLTGQIPPIICNLTSLAILDMSKNDITGMPLQCLGNFSDALSLLDLRNNHLQGTIPQTYMKQCRLVMIGLGGNQLEGQIPRSLANCVKLQLFDVGDNQINDAFPSWLGSLSELQILILRSNKFHGRIGENENSFGFPKLHIIDISFNGFTGKLPLRLFENWVSMKQVGEEKLNYLNGSIISSVSKDHWLSSQNQFAFLFSIEMTYKGAVTEYTRILDFSTAIDLSSNNFEGEIPQSIGSLKALRMLNLSNNALAGSIPPTLGNMTALEALDLSNNKLSGEIPQELVQLTFLSLLNVSYNHLTGLIPQGKQFNTFENNSFLGNDGLCGRPSSKDCSGLKPSLPPASTVEEDEGSSSPFQFGWKIVVTGYASGVVVGWVIGHIVVSRKQEWFMRTFRLGKQKKRIEIKGHNNRT